MLTFREKAVHDGSAYHRGIGAARGLVQLVQWVKKEQWVHVGEWHMVSGCSTAKFVYNGEKGRVSVEQGILSFQERWALIPPEFSVVLYIISNAKIVRV